MIRKSINSKMMKSVGYDDGAEILQIEFSNGDVWDYHDVPESVWKQFESAESQGKFFHKEIKNKYRGTRTN